MGQRNGTPTNMNDPRVAIFAAGHLKKIIIESVDSLRRVIAASAARHAAGCRLTGDHLPYGPALSFASANGITKMSSGKTPKSEFRNQSFGPRLL